MTILRSLYIAAALVTLQTPASAIVINFDVDGFGVPVPNRTPITSQYASLGVTFLGLEDSAAADIFAELDPMGATEPSEPNALSNCALCFNRVDVVRITFATPVDSVSLDLNTVGTLFVTFDVYDLSNNLLETQSATSGPALDLRYVPVTFLASGVSRIDILQPTDEWVWAMDNLTFTTAFAVPAPEALVLFGAGVIGLGAIRRRA